MITIPSPAGRSRPRAGVSVLVSVAFLAACSGARPAVTKQAATTLAQETAALRAAATSGDIAGAHDRLAEIRSTVAALRRQGELSAARAASILTSVDAVDVQLGAPTVTTTVAPTTTSSTVASSAPKAGGHGHGHH
ncbi:MAG: hypothetical protein NVSMB12_06340 [Acidimicrobiales bacterium]